MPGGGRGRRPQRRWRRRAERSARVGSAALSPSPHPPFPIPAGHGTRAAPGAAGERPGALPWGEAPAGGRVGIPVGEWRAGGAGQAGERPPGKLHRRAVGAGAAGKVKLSLLGARPGRAGLGLARDDDTGSVPVGGESSRPGEV